MESVESTRRMSPKITAIKRSPATFVLLFKCAVRGSSQWVADSLYAAAAACRRLWRHPHGRAVSAVNACNERDSASSSGGSKKEHEFNRPHYKHCVWLLKLFCYIFQRTVDFRRNSGLYPQMLIDVVLIFPSKNSCKFIAYCRFRLGLQLYVRARLLPGFNLTLAVFTWNCIIGNRMN